MFHDFIDREAQLKKVVELGEQIKKLRPDEIPNSNRIQIPRPGGEKGESLER